ncbi:MAG: DUF1592 domain-containing protein [Planctomycetaceae bacterium]|nr:DUF1592 domain-containing protein [Planctomycetaceae bacterium]
MTVIFGGIHRTAAQDTVRVHAGLQVLYTFETGQGNTVFDRSGNGPALNLKIANNDAVKWLNGALQVNSATMIKSTAPARKIIDFAKRTRGLTIEAWVDPANDRQDGPARLVTLSGNTSVRNFTLGQDANHYDVRIRTTATTKNGIPSTPTPSETASTRLTHVLVTRQADGTTRIFINGQQQATAQIKGDFGNWDDSFALSLVDEASGGRPWLGTLHLVAIYSRPLSAKEVTQNYTAGPGAKTGEMFAQRRHEQFFEVKIAPLFARNCLGCHGAENHKGKLNLARKIDAFKGGESGKVILAGNPNESLLLEQVISGDMPPEGPSLTEQEIKDLQQWIKNGAVWTVDVIDQALYANNPPTDIWLQRLTISEYIGTVKQTIGVDISEQATTLLPPDIRADGFSNTAYNLNVDLKHIETYAHLAEQIVQKVDVAEFAARFSKSRKLSTDDTMRDFVANMGAWILRGPLDEREISIYSGIATTIASAGGSFDEAAGLIIEAMIQSPRFIYRVEHQRGDGSAWPVSDYEMASRMSYILWGTSPDQPLMQAAKDGRLQDATNVAAQVKRMLENPLAKKQSARFITEWLDLDRLENLQPNAKRFPAWNASLAQDMQRETVAFFQDIVWQQKRPLSDLFNAQFTYATPQLAKFYGIATQTNSAKNELQRYDLSNVPERGGFLTHASTLTVGGDDASMVTRGLFVLNDILRGAVNDPPPGLDTTPVPVKKGLSQRSIAEKRIANSACTGCHSKFEPLAFGLEKFNGIGVFNNQDEHGNKLRADGEILFPGTAVAIQYKSASELMDLLASNKRVQETITWKLTQFALGRPLAATDARIINQIHTAAWAHEGTYQNLMTAILTSDLVMLTQTQTE